MAESYEIAFVHPRWVTNLLADRFNKISSIVKT